MQSTTKAAITGTLQGAGFMALALALLLFVAYVVNDTMHSNDCQAAADAMHTIAVNVDLFYSVEDMRAAAAPHLEFFTSECTQ